jgi:hypothetical protein
MQQVPNTRSLPKPEQWLGSVTTQATGATHPNSSTPRRAPPLHTRAMSLGSSAMSPGVSRTAPSGGGDPFDAEWAEIAARNLRQASTTTNPFIVPNTTQAFQVCLLPPSLLHCCYYPIQHLKQTSSAFPILTIKPFNTIINLVLFIFFFFKREREYYYWLCYHFFNNNKFKAGFLQ